MIKFLDGAFGTYYLEQTNDYLPCEFASITNREKVFSIHKEYVLAGVDAIKTNTFSANLVLLKNYEELEKIIKASYDIANEAVKGTKVLVFSDIGYINCEDKEYASSQYKEIAKIFIKLGAKNFLFETLSEYDVILEAVDYVKKHTIDSKIMVSFAVASDGYTKKGYYYKDLYKKACDNKNIDIVSFNCICGPSNLLNLIKNLDKKNKPLAVMPNAGYPSILNGRTVFQNNTEYFAEKIYDLHLASVDIFGGCCGTTPKHIKLAIQKINGTIEAVIEKKSESSFKYKSEINKKLLKKIAIELDPPLDNDISFLLNAVDKLKKLNVNTITIADSPLGKARADSIMTAAKLKREKNIDVIPHISCRDKNNIALKGSLLGASFEGINKVLVITGDPVANDVNLKKSGVFNFNSKELISYIKSFNEQIFKENAFSIGGAININAKNFQRELERCKIKVQNGATFLFSQAIFTDIAVENFIYAKQNLDCELYAGILPIASYKNGIFLNNEVSGIVIPDEVLLLLKDKSIEEVYEISVLYSKSIMEKVYNYADGYYIMTPLRKIDLVCKLIDGFFE